MGHSKIKPPINERLVEKNKCIHTNIMLKNGLIFILSFIIQCDNAFTKHTKYES